MNEKKDDKQMPHHHVDKKAAKEAARKNSNSDLDYGRTTDIDDVSSTNDVVSRGGEIDNVGF